MKVLVACEFSGIVRDAFKARGHYAVSCDLLCTEKQGNHICGDVLKHLDEGWDLMIAHPPCTYLTCTANRSYMCNPERWRKRLDAVLFVWELWNADIDRIAIENPVGVLSTHIGKPTQYIQPYDFGHPTSKKTGLWLKNLPKLRPTDIVSPEWVTPASGKRMSKTHAMSSSTNKPENAKLRSRTYQGIADAMSFQWGGDV